MDEKPRLVEPSLTPRRVANVLILFGFPWYTGEAQIKEYLLQVHQSLTPVTVRLYTNPTNGSSRGICFVEYNTRQKGAATTTTTTASASAVVLDVKPEFPEKEDDFLTTIKKEIEKTPFLRRYITVVLYHLTNQNWDRGGRLPDLPTDPPQTRGGVIEGYGEEGFSVRFGALLGLANTVTPSGVAHMQALRKRLREEAV